MAYGAVVSEIQRATLNGRRYYRFTVVETDAAAASEFTVAGLPAIGRILQYRATKVSGTAATIAPVVGRAAAFVAATNDFITNMFAAAISGDANEKKYAGLVANTLHIRSVVNAGTDNVVHTEVVIVEGLH